MDILNTHDPFDALRNYAVSYRPKDSEVAVLKPAMVLLEKALQNASETADHGWVHHERKLTLNGRITKGSADSFRRLLSGKIDLVQVNSAGGSVADAIEIASVIHGRKLPVTVSGYCLSSCANYIAPAASQLNIDGLIGFHGSVGNLLKQNFGRLLWRFGPFKVYQLNNLASLEDSLFANVPAPHCLLSKTQPIDRGLGDGQGWMFYAPTNEELSKDGLRFSGGQNFKYVDAFNWMATLNGWQGGMGWQRTIRQSTANDEKVSCLP